MRLALLQEHRYPPYWKWLGTAYAELLAPNRRHLIAHSRRRLASTRSALVDAYEAVARRHNELELTEQVDPTVRPFWGRPFRVLFADRFVNALRRAIVDPNLRAVDHQAGAVDSVSDNVDFLDQPSLFRELVGLYDRP